MALNIYLDFKKNKKNEVAIWGNIFHSERPSGII